MRSPVKVSLAAIVPAFCASGLTAADTVSGARQSERIYWVNFASGNIGSANLDTGQVEKALIRIPYPAHFTLKAPFSPPDWLDVHGGYVYWAYGRWIGRARLDGSGVQQSFVTDPDQPSYLAVTDAFLYWNTAGGDGGIKQAYLDGSHVSAFPLPNFHGFNGFTANDRYVYWTAPQSIGRIKTNGSHIAPTFIRTVEPAAPIASGRYIYWINEAQLGNDSIGRANLDGSHVDPHFINFPGELLVELAIDSHYIYWSNVDASSIGRANLDGKDVKPTFLRLPGAYPDRIALAASPQP